MSDRKLKLFVCLFMYNISDINLLLKKSFFDYFYIIPLNIVIMVNPVIDDYRLYSLNRNQ